MQRNTSQRGNFPSLQIVPSWRSMIQQYTQYIQLNQTLRRKYRWHTSSNSFVMLMKCRYRPDKTSIQRRMPLSTYQHHNCQLLLTVPSWRSKSLQYKQYTLLKMPKKRTYRQDKKCKQTLKRLNRFLLSKYQSQPIDPSSHSTTQLCKLCN